MAAVKADGTLWVWGDNRFGQLGNGTTVYYSSPIQVGALTNWTQVSAGFYNIAAVKTDGTLWTCGYNNYGQLVFPQVSTIVLPNLSSPIQVGALTTWKQAAAGSNFAAAIKTDGTLWAWGYNSFGQLGNNDPTLAQQSSPVQVGALTNWKQVSAAQNFAAAIKTDGTLWAWGTNTSGQLGNGTTVLYYSSPILVGALTNWSQVSAGTGFTAAVKTDGTLWAWGTNNAGQLGNGTNTAYLSPIQIGALTTWKQMSAAPNFTAAVKTDGTLWAWGTNNAGQLGIGTTVLYSSPIQVGALTNWKQVSAAQNFAAAIKTDGTLWAWGINITGQLGNGTVTTYYSPVQVGALTNWSQVSAAPNFITAVKTDGTLWACGLNTSGQLGIGTTTLYSSPVQVGALTTWSLVYAGTGFITAVKTDGTLWTCGLNTSGQLGYSTTQSSVPLQLSSPVQVGALTNWKYVAVNSSGYSMAAVKTDGTLWTCGYNGQGQLGNSTIVSYSSPVQVGALTNWSTVATGVNNTAAIKTDGTLWTWGIDNYGQLGNGTSAWYSSPVQVGALTTWNTVSVGNNSMVATATPAAPTFTINIGPGVKFNT